MKHRILGIGLSLASSVAVNAVSILALAGPFEMAWNHSVVPLVGAKTLGYFGAVALLGGIWMVNIAWSGSSIKLTLQERE